MDIGDQIILVIKLLNAIINSLIVKEEQKILLVLKDTLEPYAKNAIY